MYSSLNANAMFPSVPALVGRDQELNALQHLLRRAVDGVGSLALISGEAGIGKTSLVRKLRAMATETEALVLTGAAYDLTSTPPYGPWLELIRDYPRDTDLPPLPEFMTNREAVAALGSQEELQQAVMTFFQHVAEVRPLVLVLEDLHWSDQSSLELLRVIARSIGKDRILLVATWRDDEVSRQHPLYTILPSLIRESQSERVELRALDQRGVSQLVGSRFDLSSRDQGRLVDYLLRRGDGNPLFTVELLRTLQVEADLRSENGAWRIERLPEERVPDLVRQMVERRLADVAPGTLAALQAAAVHGQSISLERWEQITEEPVSAAAEEAVNTHLVEEIPHNQELAFPHSLVREAIYDTIPLTQRRETHGTVASVYLTEVDPDPDTVAWHLKQARDPRTPEWLIQAGEQAERRYAWQAALDRHEEAAALLREQRDQGQLLARLLLRMGRLLRFRDQTRATAYLEESRRVAERIGDEVTAAFALFNTGAYERYVGSTRPRIKKMLDAIEILSNTEQNIDPTARWAMTTMGVELEPLRLITGSCAQQLALLGRFHDALDLGKRYTPEDWDADPVVIPERSERYPSVSDADAYGALGFSFNYLGMPQKAELAFRLRRELVERVNFRAYLLLQHNDRILHEHFPYRTRDLQERYTVSREIESDGGETGQAVSPSNATWGLEYCYLLDGRWDELRERINAGHVPSMDLAKQLTILIHGRLAVYEGNVERAQTSLMQLMPAGPDEDPDHHVHRWPGEAQRLGARIALACDDVDLARRWMVSHDKWMDWTGAVLGRAEGELLWGEIERRSGDHEPALVHGQRALELASEPEQPLTLIQVHRFLGDLAVDVRDFELAAQHLSTSREIVEECELPYERALTVLAEAELEFARSNHETARELLADALRVLNELAAGPALERARRLEARVRPNEDSRPFDLSPRELEILRLVARGMSDKEIAEKLFISPHTVIRHVASVRRKLNVDSRTAAATEAMRQGIV